MICEGTEHPCVPYDCARRVHRRTGKFEEAVVTYEKAILSFLHTDVSKKEDILFISCRTTYQNLTARHHSVDDISKVT